MFTHSFYELRSQKRKNIVKSSVSFYALGFFACKKLCIKRWWNLLQGEDGCSDSVRRRKFRNQLLRLQELAGGCRDRRELQRRQLDRQRPGVNFIKILWALFFIQNLYVQLFCTFGFMLVLLKLIITFIYILWAPFPLFLYKIYTCSFSLPLKNVKFCCDWL